MSKIKWMICLLAAVAAVFWYFNRPFFFVSSNQHLLSAIPAKPGLEFSTRFIHSVQKTPVEEFFVINDAMNGFVLKSTRYQSFGVGLPFLESEGQFRHEGNYFIMDDMNRPIGELILRPGIGTEFTLIIGRKRYPLHERVLPGAAVRLWVGPYYSVWSGQCPGHSPGKVGRIT